MVVKLDAWLCAGFVPFESSVISYGSKTCIKKQWDINMFESSVISYGSKTVRMTYKELQPFESSVISYGSKTILIMSRGI